MKEEISDMIVGYELFMEYYIEKLVEGILIIGVVFLLEKVIVCMLDFKLNEYFNLVGGY